MSDVPDPKLSELAVEFLAEKRLAASNPERNNSDRARHTDLVRMARAMQPPDSTHPAVHKLDELDGLRIADVSRRTVVAALAAMSETHSKATVQRTFSTWRQFTRWLTKLGHLTVDPCEELSVSSAPTEIDPANKHFRHDEIGALRVAAQHPARATPTAWPARDLAIVDVLAGCGLRASELCALDISSIDQEREHPMLLIRSGSKGGKPRNIPIPRRVTASIAGYLDERQRRPEVSAIVERALFIRTNRSGTSRIDPNWLHRLVLRLCADAGVTPRPGAAAHAFRHSYGVELARRRVPPFLLADLLGHADVRTTQAYAKHSGDLAVDTLDDAGWL